MKTFSRLLCGMLFLAVTALAQADQTILTVQQKLRRLGFYDGKLDGEMGSQTAAAIRRYQLAEDLRVTGELNAQTLQKLGIAPVKPASPAAKPVPAYVALADIFRGGPYISVGPEAQIATIKQAQKNLRLLGYYKGPIDGAPSPPLVTALKAWQQSAGFRQTGRFDESTLKGLDLMPN